MTDASVFSQPIQAPAPPGPTTAPIDSLFGGAAPSDGASEQPSALNGGGSDALDALFGAPAPIKTGPLADLSASVAPMGRILNAFGQGAAHQWGSAPTTPGPVTQALNGIEGGKDVTKQQGGMQKGFNEAFLRPAASVLDNAIRAAGNIGPTFGAGLQAEAAQLEKERGPGLVSGLTRSLVNATIPPQHTDVAAARATGAIGEGESSFFGAKQPTPDQLRERAAAAQELTQGGMVTPLERMNMSIAKYKATGGPLGDIGRALERDFDNIADIRAKKQEAADAGNWLEYSKHSAMESYARLGSVIDTVFPAVSEPLAQLQSKIAPPAGTFQEFVPEKAGPNGKMIPGHYKTVTVTPEQRAEAWEGVANLEAAAIPIEGIVGGVKALGGTAKAAEAVKGAEGVRETAAAEAHAEPAPSPPRPETVAEEAAPPKAEVPAAPAEPPLPDIHQVARKVDPQTFDQWDSLQLAAAKERENLAQLAAERETSVEAASARDALHETLGVEPGQVLSPEALDERVQAVAASASEEHLSRLGEAYDRYDAALTEPTAEMVTARERLMDINHQLGDLAVPVSEAYRRAADLLPETEEAGEASSTWTPEKEAQFQEGQRVREAVAARDAEASAPDVVGERAPVGAQAEAPGGAVTASGAAPEATEVQGEGTAPAAGRSGSLRPVQGTGEEKLRGLSVSAEASAIDKGLTEGFSESPTYRVVQDEPQGAKVVEHMDKDWDKAVQIAMGERAPPSGILANAFYVGVYNRAGQLGDVALMEKLATRSRLIGASTTMGQNISYLRNLNREGFLEGVRELKAAKEADFAARNKGVSLEALRDQTVAKDAEAVAKEKKVVAPKLDRLAAFLDSIRCS